MKTIFTLVLLIGLSFSTFNCQSGDQFEGTVSLETKKDSISYVIGTDMARSLVQIKDEIELEKVFHGMKDRLNDKPLQVERQEAQSMMRDFSMKIRQQQQQENQVAAQENLSKGEAFLEENKNKEGVQTTESGLQYQVIEKGLGPKPTESDKVKVHYHGTTIDGSIFDSSYERGQPATFPVTGVIKGWTEALLMMNVGSKYKLYIPPDLGYGTRGAGQKIGPNEVLIFEVELLGIE